MTKETIRDSLGRIIGYYEHMPNGDITVRDFYGTILGYYRKNDDTTRNFHNVIVARGNCVGMLLR